MNPLHITHAAEPDAGGLHRMAREFGPPRNDSEREYYEHVSRWYSFAAIDREYQRENGTIPLQIIAKTVNHWRTVCKDALSRARKELNP